MSLRELKAAWTGCQRCTLAKTRSKVVFGSAVATGSGPGPVVLVVGEGPGRNEDETGEAFVGKSGAILRDDILAPAGVRIALITNCVGCRPPDNRDPTAEEIGACSDRVRSIAAEVQPDLIVVVGRIAKEAIESGTWGADVARIPAVSIVHPAALLRAGWPNKATRQRVGLAVVRIRRAIEKATAALPRPAVSTEPAAPDPDRPCEHDHVRIGTWGGKGNGRAMMGCRRCGAIASAFAAEP